MNPNKEPRLHTSSAHSYSYYDSRIPDFFSQVPLHWHEEFEINYIREGEANCLIGQTAYPVKKGTLIFLLPQTLHAISCAKGSHCHYDTLVFSAALLGAEAIHPDTTQLLHPLLHGTFRSIAPINASSPDGSLLCALSQNLFASVKEPDSYAILHTRSILQEILYLLYKNSYLQIQVPTKTVLSDQLKQILQYIQQNYSSPLSISHLAQTFHLSESYFMSMFQKQVGCGATEYLIQVRLRHACKQLRETDTTIATVAYGCGFSNLSNFNRLFKRSTGVTPREYRQRFSSTPS